MSFVHEASNLWLCKSAFPRCCEYREIEATKWLEDKILEKAAELLCLNRCCKLCAGHHKLQYSLYQLLWGGKVLCQLLSKLLSFYEHKNIRQETVQEIAFFLQVIKHVSESITCIQKHPNVNQVIADTSLSVNDETTKPPLMIILRSGQLYQYLNVKFDKSTNRQEHRPKPLIGRWRLST